MGETKRLDKEKLESIPNVGPVIANKLRLLGIHKPADLKGQDPYFLFDHLCDLTGERHDFCLLDVFISAVSFMNGNPAQPWWKYTATRKVQLKDRLRHY